MENLFWYQYLLIGLIFVWSGFVRTGFGFGGAVLSLPFLLLVVDQPTIFLPIIAVHLLVFSSITVFQNHRHSKINSKQVTVNWHYLRYALLIMIVPKFIGVFGLITLPNTVLSSIIFGIVAIYAVSYILNKKFSSMNPWIEKVLLILGGYVSGTSLTSAPLIMTVFANHVSKHQLRDTLFVLWFILVSIKLSAFIYVGIDLQLVHHLWLLPCATLGHLIGLRTHRYLLEIETVKFYRMLGVVLLIVSSAGLFKAMS